MPSNTKKRNLQDKKELSHLEENQRIQIVETNTSIVGCNPRSVNSYIPKGEHGITGPTGPTGPTGRYDTSRDRDHLRLNRRDSGPQARRRMLCMRTDPCKCLPWLDGGLSIVFSSPRNSLHHPSRRA